MHQEWLKTALAIAQEKNIESAVNFQKSLFDNIELSDHFDHVELIAGVDLAYSPEEAYCSIVVMKRDTMEKVEVVNAKSPITFPYVPGLLFFREFPVFYKAYRKLKNQPDILIFDGHGLSHQRMMGIATMAGIILEKPTIGCAKTHLYGDYKMPDEKKFSASELRAKGLLVGYVLRSKDRVKPIFISTGYRVSPQTSIEIVKTLLTTYKLPLPTHLAHQECERFKNA